MTPSRLAWNRRMIAVIEAIIGQLYLVSVVALVVSAFGKRKG